MHIFQTSKSLFFSETKLTTILVCDDKLVLVLQQPAEALAPPLDLRDCTVPYLQRTFCCCWNSHCLRSEADRSTVISEAD